MSSELSVCLQVAVDSGACLACTATTINRLGDTAWVLAACISGYPAAFAVNSKAASSCACLQQILRANFRVHGMTQWLLDPFAKS